MGVNQCISGADWGAGLFVSEARIAHFQVLPKLNSRSRTRAFNIAAYSSPLAEVANFRKLNSTAATIA